MPGPSGWLDRRPRRRLPFAWAIAASLALFGALWLAQRDTATESATVEQNR